MRYLHATNQEVKNIEAQLAENGVANFKNRKIVKTEMGYKESEGLVYGESIEEVIFDINNLQSSYDYEDELSKINKFSTSFTSCLEKL